MARLPRGNVVGPSAIELTTEEVTMTLGFIHDQISDPVP